MTKQGEDAQWLHEHRDEIEGEEIEFEVAKPRTISFAFRLPQDEADAIRAAAGEAGVSVSEFIRSACRTSVAQHAQGRSPAQERWAAHILAHLQLVAEASRSITEHVNDATGELDELKHLTNH